jgi:GDP-L-fucose synthase
MFHAAAYYGGIGINVAQPARLYYENLVMGANLMEAARLARVGKFVAIGTACSYPGYLEGDLKEEDLWAGPCHASVINYGLTKKMMAVQAQAYKRQYGLDSIHLILTNLYGPGDSYNPERSHVVAALVRKWVEAEMAGAPSIEVWGTGAPVREFLYVEDCADAIVLAAEKYDDAATPLNIGTGVGTSIRELAETINAVTGYRGRLLWNADKPDGAAKKVLDVARMRRVFDGWTPPTRLRDGLEKTIAWYRANKAQADAKW